MIFVLPNGKYRPYIIIDKDTRHQISTTDFDKVDEAASARMAMIKEHFPNNKELLQREPKVFEATITDEDLYALAVMVSLEVAMINGSNLQAHKDGKDIPYTVGKITKSANTLQNQLAKRGIL